MVIAEMIATGDLARLTRPGLELDLTRPGHASPACPSTKASGLAMSCCTSRASSSPICSTRTARQEVRRLDDGARLAAALDRRHAVAPRRRLRGRASRGARSLSHVRQRPRLGAPAGRGDPQRPDGGSGGREGAERHARAHAAHDRPLSARADERFRRSRQPAAAPADGPRRRRTSRQLAAEGRDHRRPLDGGGRTARLSARQAARPGAGRRRGHQPCRHRRARHGHSGRRPDEGRRVAWRKTATPSSSTARTAPCASAAAGRPRSAYAEKVRFRARRQEQSTGSCASSRRDQGRRSRSIC